MPLERFIPFRKHDVSRLCENVIVQERTLFRTFSTLLVNRIHYQYHEQLEGLKDSYNDFDPNKDTRDLLVKLLGSKAKRHFRVRSPIY